MNRFLLLILFCLVSKSVLANDFNEALNWVNTKDSKYPFDKINGKDFWHIPSIRNAIIKLLGFEEYQSIMSEWTGPSAPIEKINHYIIADTCKAHACSTNSLLLVINLSENALYICQVLEVSADNFKKLFFASTLKGPTLLGQFKDWKTIPQCIVNKSGKRDFESILAEFKKYGMK